MPHRALSLRYARCVNAHWSPAHARARVRARMCVRVEAQECIWEYIKDSHSECPSCRNPGTNRRSLSRNNQLRNITGIAKRLATALGALGFRVQGLGVRALPLVMSTGSLGLKV